jgi:CubicO group peptidase (beta-lactamase class C family)
VCGRAVSAQERGASSAIGDRVNRLERQLEDLRGTLKIPGISAAVVKDQKLLWVKGFGSADVENTTPSTPETNYRIASLTKPFASPLLMQLVERGKLDLDEAMAKYSPEFRQRFGRGPITVRHVLTHTSHDPSGDTYWYDGYRFSFLSDVVARASGHPFRELLVKNILDAIGMADSVPGQDVLDDRAKWSAFLDADHSRRYEAGLGKLAKPYRLDGAVTVRSLALLEAARTEARVALARQQRWAERAVLAGRRRRHALGLRRQLPENLRARGESGSGAARPAMVTSERPVQRGG